MSFVVLGKLSRLHGFRGGLVASSDSGSGSSLEYLKEVWVGTENTPEKKFPVLEASWMPKGWKLQLEGIDTEELARKLIGKMILAERIQLLPTEKDEYYEHDLVGCEVWDEDQNVFCGSFLGTEPVQGSADRWWFSVNDTPSSIPATKRYVSRFDSKEKKLWLKNLADFSSNA